MLSLLLDDPVIVLDAAMAPEHRGWRRTSRTLDLEAELAHPLGFWAGFDAAIYAVGPVWWADLHVTRPDLRRDFTRFTTPHGSPAEAVAAMVAHLAAGYSFLEVGFR
jgi:hypothetical protein